MSFFGLNDVARQIDVIRTQFKQRYENHFLVCFSLFLKINLDTLNEVYEIIKGIRKAVRIVPMARITLISM